jgi:hypothetical protein
MSLQPSRHGSAPRAVQFRNAKRAADARENSSTGFLRGAH